MWSSREEQLIREYGEEIRELYHRGSRVPFLTTVKREPDPEAPDFWKIGKRFTIPREFFEVGYRIIVHPFADFIELSEYQYLIDALKETAAHRFGHDTFPDKEIVDAAIGRLIEYPNYMIVPIAFYVRFHQWSRASEVPCVDYEDGQAYYRYGGRRLRILWSNKFIRLNEIIVGNSRDSQWLFKSANGDERLTVRFYFEENLTDPILLVQTVYKFYPPSPKRICVIEFPESLLLSHG